MIRGGETSGTVSADADIVIERDGLRPFGGFRAVPFFFSAGRFKKIIAPQGAEARSTGLKLCPQRKQGGQVNREGPKSLNALMRRVLSCSFGATGALPFSRPLVGVALLVISGCAQTIERSPTPPGEIDAVAPYGIRVAGDDVRYWGDRVSREEIDLIVELTVRDYAELLGDRHPEGKPFTETALALSGGGPDGAFGAGLLRGLEERGERPDYTVVTGVSTGAIIAVFAFLGPEYDDVLEDMYTSYSTDDLVDVTLFEALTGGIAFTDASGYRSLLEFYIDDDVVAAIAARYRSGHTLLIGTTNLDTVRPGDLERGRHSRIRAS